MRNRIFKHAVVMAVLYCSSISAVPAFPGAQGGGAVSTGGRGGAIIEVTTLADAGTGSFRAACLASGARTVVFRVGGTINLVSEITLTNPNITIAGQTAPGGGILLSGRNMPAGSGNAPLTIKTHNVVVRFIRVRVGNGAFADQEGDCISIRGNTGANVSNIIIDHCSISWCKDENFEIWSQGAYIKNVTFSWNISAEGLAGHSKGAIIGSHISDARLNMGQIDIHHNILMSNDERNPYMGIKEQTIINNLVYNWGSFGIGPRGGVQVDIIGNICKAGPQSGASGDILFFPNNSSSCENGTYCIEGDPSIYIQGNVGVGNTNPDTDNWAMISGWTMAQGHYALPVSYRRTTAPLSTTYPRAFPVKVNHVTQDRLQDTLLADAGSCRRVDENGLWISNRDTVDRRLVREVKNGTGQIPASESNVGGFPVIAAGTPYADTDHDGMADQWETARFGSVSRDGKLDYDSDGFTDVEEFLNGSNPKDGTTGTIDRGAMRMKSGRSGSSNSGVLYDLRGRRVVLGDRGFNHHRQGILFSGERSVSFGHRKWQ